MRPLQIQISEELYATSNVKGAGLFDAMKEAARARGFVAVEGDGQAQGHARLLALGSGGKGGARVRADLGAHAQPIAAAAARAMGVPVTIVSVSGTAVGAAKKLTISLSARAVQVDRTGKARVLRVEIEDGDYEQDADLDWRDELELERAGYDHAGNVLDEAARALNLSLMDEGPRVPYRLRRPTGTPRVEELASLIATASGHELVKQPDGRFLVRILLGDGKRLAYLSGAEAEELTKLLAR
jgi:hypothetical protein